MLIRIMFLPNAYKDEEKADQNCTTIRKTIFVPIRIAANDKFECNWLYSELLIISFKT